MSNLSIGQKLRLAERAIKAPAKALSSNVKKAAGNTLQAQANAARGLSKTRLMKAIIDETGADIREASKVRKQSGRDLQAKNEARLILHAFRKDEPMVLSKHMDKLYKIAAKVVTDPNSGHHGETEDQFVHDTIVKYLNRPSMRNMNFDHFDANVCEDAIMDELNGSDVDRHKMQGTVGRNVGTFQNVVNSHARLEQDETMRQIDGELKEIYKNQPKGPPLPTMEASARSALQEFGRKSIDYFLLHIRKLYVRAEQYCDSMAKRDGIKYDLEATVVSALRDQLDKLPDDHPAKQEAQAITDFMIRNSEYKKFTTWTDIPATPLLVHYLDLLSKAIGPGGPAVKAPAPETLGVKFGAKSLLPNAQVQKNPDGPVPNRYKIGTEEYFARFEE